MFSRPSPNRNADFFTVALVAMLTLSACSGEEKSTTTTNAGSDSAMIADKVNSGKSDSSVAQEPVSKQQVIIGQTTWRYQNRIDADGNTTHKASLVSPTRLQFGFPYEGGSSVTLIVRKQDNEKATVYLQVSRGQFNKSFQGGKVQISSDGRAPQTYTYTAAANGSSTVIFFDKADALIHQLKTARNLTIDVMFFSQGNRKIEFRTADLRWNH